MSAEALSTQVVTASCGFACRIILLCKAHCAAWRKTEKDQTTTNTSRTKYIQLYPTISNYHVLICSVYLSLPLSLLFLHLDPLSCAPRSAPTTFANSLMPNLLFDLLHRLRLKVHDMMAAVMFKVIHIHVGISSPFCARLTSLDTTPQETQPC